MVEDSAAPLLPLPPKCGAADISAKPTRDIDWTAPGAAAITRTMSDGERPRDRQDDRAAFRAEALGCVRGGRAVFAGLDMTVTAGQSAFLVGPNGSGKSSLLRVLCGLLPAAAGTLSWNGAPVGDDPEAHRARLAYVGHHNAVKPVATASETLGFWVSVGGGDPASVRPALDRLGLGPIADEPVLYLSAGQKRRLALARLLALDRPLWLLDEPTVGLDAESVDTFEAMLRDHLDRGGLAVVATHLAIDTGGRGHAVDLAAFPGGQLDRDRLWDEAEPDGNSGAAA